MQSVLPAPPWEPDQGRGPCKGSNPLAHLPCLHLIPGHGDCPEEKSRGHPERMIFLACQHHSAACPLSRHLLYLCAYLETNSQPRVRTDPSLGRPGTVLSPWGTVTWGQHALGEGSPFCTRTSCSFANLSEQRNALGSSCHTGGWDSPQSL